MRHIMGSAFMPGYCGGICSVFAMDVPVQDRFGDTHENWVGETVQTVTFLASVLMSLALVIGCADSAEQRLSQMQNELERVLRTALRDGDVRMQRTNDHLTVVIAERLLFDAGSRETQTGWYRGAETDGSPLQDVLFQGNPSGWAR